ncbi:uncharacterized protein Fot_35257 [Forsythia ovata]|uniref:C2H2-type domain-containing protein n=1 Tax=Forsythia ovata TaxID=205694 RepID=A0ABD1SL06_9LAMI
MEGAPAGGGPAPERRNPFQCTICGKPCVLAKALFGHMRSHPDRGWKGAFPPPSFSVEEEFFDVPFQNRGPAAEGDGGVPQIEDVPQVDNNPLEKEENAHAQSREDRWCNGPANLQSSRFELFTSPRREALYIVGIYIALFYALGDVGHTCQFVHIVWGGVGKNDFFELENNINLNKIKLFKIYLYFCKG